MNRIVNSAATFVTVGRCAKFALATTLLYIGALILTPFPHYFPPDFDHGFLRNKESFFYSSGYFLGFYVHITTSPIALACGVVQMSRTLRTGWPRIHRFLGGVYVALVLCFVAPGGAIMSMRAFGGWASMICFFLISVLAWGFTFLAWRAAKANRYAEHGRWMCRSYLMMCSAIMLRLIHYLIQPLQLDPTLAYQLAAWLSWIPPLAVLEFANWKRRSLARPPRK